MIVYTNDEEGNEVEVSLLVLPHLTDQNTYTDKNRTSRYQGAEIKRRETNLVAWEAKLQKIKKYQKIDLEIRYYCKNKRKDKDNVSFVKKFILDGLVKAGVIENDGWKHVGGWRERFRVDKEHPRIEVMIFESRDREETE